MSARRRRLRGAQARGGVRGMARGPGEAAARAAGDNRGRRKRKCGIDEWNRELGIGCSGQRKDFRELGFRF